MDLLFFVADCKIEAYHRHVTHPEKKQHEAWLYLTFEIGVDSIQNQKKNKNIIRALLDPLQYLSSSSVDVI